LPPILGRVRDARAQRVLRVPDPDRPAVDKHLAGVRRSDTEQRQSHIRPARPDEPREAEYFAGADREGDTGERSLASEAADLEDGIAQTGRRAPEKLAHGPPDHVADGRTWCHLGGGSRRDPTAVAQDRDAIGDLKDILHAVRDEEDGNALATKGLDDPEEAAHLVSRQ